MNLTFSETGNRNMTMQTLVSGNKVEAPSVIVAKSYAVTTSNPSTPSHRGIGHSIARLAETEKKDNSMSNHVQFYSKQSYLFIPK